MSSSVLLVVCSVTLFLLTIPPVLGAQADDSSQGGVFGFFRSGDTAGATDGASGSAGSTEGGSLPLGGGVAAIGAGSAGGASDATGAQLGADGQLTAQETQSGSDGSPSTEELQAAENALVNHFNNAKDHYARLSNLAAGSPMFWTYGPETDSNAVRNWGGMQQMYDLSRECISEASAYASWLSSTNFRHPSYNSQYDTLNNAWSYLSRASEIIIRFVDSVRACPDPATCYGCFMGDLSGHIIPVSSGGQTVYTLQELENARQLLNRF